MLKNCLTSKNMTSDFAPEVAKYPKSILPQQQIRECGSLVFRSVRDAACYTKKAWEFSFVVLTFHGPNVLMSKQQCQIQEYFVGACWRKCKKLCTIMRICTGKNKWISRLKQTWVTNVHKSTVHKNNENLDVKCFVAINFVWNYLDKF